MLIKNMLENRRKKILNAFPKEEYYINIGLVVTTSIRDVGF